MREEAFTCAPASSEAARTNPNITVLYNTQVESVAGDSALRSITYKNLKTGEKTTFAPEDGDSIGVFVFAGYAPETDLVKELAQTDDYGYLITNEHQETTREGLFGAGDVCQKPLRQVATAIGQAATTATEMERYIKRAQEKTGLVPQMNVTRISSKKEAPEAPAAKSASDSGEIFTDDMKAQLNAVFERMARPLVLQLELDQRPVSEELVAYMEELSSMTDKLSVQTVSDTGEKNLPVVRVCAQDGTPTGLAFHGVPGGHEFTSFVLGLYNAAGPGQPISDEDKVSIAAIESKTHLQVLVGLSCTMCPDVVVAAQRIAADNPQIPQLLLKQKYEGEMDHIFIFSFDESDSQAFKVQEQVLFEGVARVGGSRASLQATSDGNGLIVTSWQSGTGQTWINRYVVSGHDISSTTEWEGRIDRRPKDPSAIDIDWYEATDKSGLEQIAPSNN